MRDTCADIFKLAFRFGSIAAKSDPIFEEDRKITDRTTSTNASNSLEGDTPILHVWGGKPLSGTVRASGAKNAALAIMAGVLLCPEECRLQNVPNLVDISRMGEVLSALGLRLRREGDVLEIRGDLCHSEAPYELVSQLRASFFAIGPILTRLGEARIPLPGGCAIGARPVDFHVRGLQAMGAEVQIEHGIVRAFVKGRDRRLQGARIYLDYPSVGATETLMMAAVLADGETIIENAAQEPEVVDLANFCRAMGARIRGAGTKKISILGVDRLHGVDYSVVPDRIEAGTFLVIGAITRSEIAVDRIVPEHLNATVSKLQEIGVKIVAEGHHCLRVVSGGELHGTDIETLPYPGFPTDMQAQFTSLLSVASGNSIITETVFENRLRHAAELNRMGADIRVKGNNAVIKGVSCLSGAPVEATDLRASAALVAAGLAAQGKTTIQGLHHLDRGYANLEDKLRGLGARIERTVLAETAIL